VPRLVRALEGVPIASSVTGFRSSLALARNGEMWRGGYGYCAGPRGGASTLSNCCQGWSKVCLWALPYFASQLVGAWQYAFEQMARTCAGESSAVSAQRRRTHPRSWAEPNELKAKGPGCAFLLACLRVLSAIGAAAIPGIAIGQLRNSALRRKQVFTRAARLALGSAAPL